MELRHLADDDVADAAAVFVTSLGAPAPKEPERYQRYWDVPTSLGVWDDRGRCLGVAARFASEFTAVGGTALPCTAVPSVGVRPDAHRRGVGRMLLERQVREAVEHGDAVMALNASEVQIYGRFGYGPTSTWWSVEADPRVLAWRPAAPQAAPGAIEEVDLTTVGTLLPDLHARCFGRWAGELARHEGWWHAAFLPREGRPAPTVAVLRDEDDVPVAAVAYTSKQAFDDIGFANALEVRDLFGTDPGTEARLLRWLLDRRLVGKVSVERLHPGSPVKWMLEDGRRLRTTAAEDGVWVRVLDVPTVVASRTTLVGAGEVVVDVHDRLVTRNEGHWRIAAADGGLTCEPTDAPAAVALDVQYLAPLLWGFTEPTRLADAGLLDVADAAGLATLQHLLAVDTPSWCSTGF